MYDPRDYTWAGAEAVCVAWGGHLASFHSAAEHTVVLDRLQVDERARRGPVGA